jgi:hypothetical protein
MLRVLVREITEWKRPGQVHPGGATLPDFPNGSSDWGHWPAIATANNVFEYNTIDTCGFECDDTG